MADNGWRDVVLMTIRENASKKEGKADEGYGLWVVARVKPDNTLFNVTVRSGRYYPNKVTGSKELPKDGLGHYDFLALRDKAAWDQVERLLDPKRPPVIPDPGAEPAASPPPPEPEMPPWMKP